MVLLKELPEQIQNSVEAYIGCLSGAMLKEDYLKAVEDAGFTDIKIIDEVVFPIESMLNDPTAKALIKNLKLDQEKIEDLKGAVVSIKFSGKKTS